MHRRFITFVLVTPQNRRRRFLNGIATFLFFYLTITSFLDATNKAYSADNPRRPNVVLFFADDLGYADLGCYGAKGYQTPRLDKMATEGMRFTDFHVPMAVCSASRAALLTGCYPGRVSILGALGPNSKKGIHADETLLPEILKKQGYATAIFGKWHLGDAPQFLPTRHGFDEYFGIPYSNDMWPKHPTAKHYPDLPLIDGEKIVQTNPDQSQLTTWYTEHAVKFIETHRHEPFFVYVAHNMCHVPLFVSDKFRGQSQRGLFGDVLMELDWSVGQVLDTLQRLGLDDETLVIFTSDNGPWLSYGEHAGSAGPLREGKGTSWEGGHREPCIVRWPGKVPAGKTCNELCTTMDFLPTIAKLAGSAAPNDRPIDGHDVWPLLAGEPNAKSPYEVFYCYYDDRLEAIRAGRWKLHFPHTYRSFVGNGGRDGRPVNYQERRNGLELYDLETDVGETTNVAERHPDVVAKLQALAETARNDLGDSLQKRTGKNVRPAGRL